MKGVNNPYSEKCLLSDRKRSPWATCPLIIYCTPAPVRILHNSRGRSLKPIGIGHLSSTVMGVLSFQTSCLPEA